jgi:hypothetical protein
MDTHLHARSRRRPAAVAVAIAGLAFLSAGCASSAASRSTAPSVAASVDAHVMVYGNCTAPAVEPKEIVLACADYGTLLEGLRWTSWTATSATAVGTLVYNDCLPSCVAGHHHDIPGTAVTLTRPVPRDGGPLLWSRVQESPQPPGYATGPDHGGPQALPLGPV